MTDLMIIAIDTKYAIVCMADHVNKENMWDTVIGHVDVKKNKRKADIELNGEILGRVDYFEEAMPILEKKLGIKCQYSSYKFM